MKLLRALSILVSYLIVSPILIWKPIFATFVANFGASPVLIYPGIAAVIVTIGLIVWTINELDKFFN